MRLDKYISNMTNYSRKEVKRLLKEGVVAVDGISISDPSAQISPEQEVTLYDAALGRPANRYFMLNKPRGYVCATRDSEHPIVLDLINEPNLEKLQIVGRLDIDTTGLVLLTDDGKWNHAVTSPNRGCKKIYYACTAESIPEKAVEKFSRGIMLEGEKRRTKPATLEKLYDNEARLTIAEGRYHQVKRMFGALGNRVIELHREAVGDIVLDPELEEGEYRALSREEVESIYLVTGDGE